MTFKLPKNAAISRGVQEMHAGLNLEKQNSYDVKIPSAPPDEREELLSALSFTENYSPMPPRISARSSVRKFKKNSKPDLGDIKILT